MTAAQIVLLHTNIGAIEEKSYKTKTLYYCDKRLKGGGKCRFRFMFNAWPNIEEVVQEKNLTNKYSKQSKEMVLKYNADIPCHVFNIKKKQRYWHWAALTPQFYHNDAV